jgi:hypothetical protein
MDAVLDGLAVVVLLEQQRDRIGHHRRLPERRQGPGAAFVDGAIERKGQGLLIDSPNVSLLSVLRITGGARLSIAFQ